MKRILFLMCWILVFAGGLQAQNLYDYDYDASGNRIRRRVITLKTDSAPIFTEDRGSDATMLDDGNVRLYPNPTQGVVVFESADGVEIARYRLSDAGGKLIVAGSGGSLLRLDLSGRSIGVYLLEVVLEGERKYYKIIKQ